MRRSIFFLFLLAGSLHANKYDYLLFSNVYTDVRRGIELGASVHTRMRGSTPLYDAARKGNMDILFLLLNRGADINAKCHGETALHKVVQFKNLKMAKALLDSGAHHSEKDEVKGNTPLHYAVYNNDSRMISLLLSYGADMQKKNNNGDTPARFILSRADIPPLSIQNNHIALTSSSFRAGGGGVTFNIRNLTDEFVTIHHSALYINGDLISKRELKHVIPPNSTAHNVASITVGVNALSDVKVSSDGVANMKYGFGIEYSVGNKRASLYEHAKISLPIWTPSRNARF